MVKMILIILLFTQPIPIFAAQPFVGAGSAQEIKMDLDGLSCVYDGTKLRLVKPESISFDYDIKEQEFKKVNSSSVFDMALFAGGGIVAVICSGFAGIACTKYISANDGYGSNSKADEAFFGKTTLAALGGLVGSIATLGSIATSAVGLRNQNSTARYTISILEMLASCAIFFHFKNNTK